MTTGVITLGRAGEVLEMNREAERIVQLGDGLSITRGRLVASQPNPTEQLRRLIGLAAERSLGLGLEEEGSLAIERLSFKRPFAVSVVPARSNREEILGLGVAALVFVRDPEQQPTPPIPAIRRRWNLTKREAEVTSLLARGESILLIAERLEIGESTVRTHLKHVLSKTGTTRQSELVALIYRNLVALQG